MADSPVSHSVFSSLRWAVAAADPAYGPLPIIHEVGHLVGHDPTQVDEARFIQVLREWPQRGISGVVCNVSLTNYLRDEGAWKIFTTFVRAAMSLGLRIWVYDESGYPSGTAGGQVVRQRPELEAVGLVQLCDTVGPGPVRLPAPRAFAYAVSAYATVDGQTVDLSGCFRADGTWTWTAPAQVRVERYVCRRAFEGTHATLNVSAVRRYINVLEPEATQAFLASTHAQYAARLSELWGRVEAVFTDEPSFMTAFQPPLPDRYVGRIPVEDEPDPLVQPLPMLPWWRALPQAFRRAYGYDILPHLALLFHQESPTNGVAASRVRQDFHELVARQFATAYFGPQQAYLEPDGIALTGHLLHEELFWHHAACSGSALLTLAQLRIPGCDILSCDPAMIIDTMRLLTPKYASSVGHLCRRTEIMTEYSDWEERNRGHYATLSQRRGTAGLLGVLGITTFTSYLGWKEFAPEERDQHARCVARICAAVRQGTHQAGVALLYPIRSVWARFEPVDRWQGPQERPAWLQELESACYDVARMLLSKQRDFDFVDEDLLLRATLHQGAWHIADETFTVLVLPPGTLLAERVAERIAAFLRSGGTVVAFRPQPMVRYGTGLEGREEPLTHRLGSDRSLLLFDTDDPTWLSVLSAHVPPALHFDPPVHTLFVRHARVAGGDICLIVNTNTEAYAGSVRFPAGEGAVECWDPWTGAQVLPEPFTIEGHGVRIVLREGPKQPALVPVGGTTGTPDENPPQNREA